MESKNNKEKLLKKYYDLKQQEKIIKDETTKIASEILEIMSWENATQYKNDFGTYSVVTRTTYEYSDNVTELETKLKNAKKVEELNEIAKPKQSQSLLFRINK